MRTYTRTGPRRPRQISILAKLEMDMEARRMLEFSSGLRRVGIDSSLRTSPLIFPDLSNHRNFLLLQEISANRTL